MYVIVRVLIICSLSASAAFSALADSSVSSSAEKTYVDAAQCLWIKERRRVSCLDLKTLRYIRGCLAVAAVELSGPSFKTAKTAKAAKIAKAATPAKSISGLFVDSGGGLWVVSGSSASGAVQSVFAGGITVSEVSDATGFSSPSYFTKCFQKEFGCRPTEYEAE